MESTDGCFHIQLNDACKSKAHICFDENGKRQIKFDPPAYQQRYIAVLSILSNEKWCDQMKKVNNEMQ